MVTDGKAAEVLANDWLLSQGRKLIARNLWLAEGEIDWLGWDGDEITLVEVKATSVNPEIAAQRINHKKIERMRLLADRVRQEHPEWKDTTIRLEALIMYRSRANLPWNFSIFTINESDE